MNITSAGREKILIVKLGALGDAAMALPMIEAIRNQYPDAEITWLCGNTIEPLLKLVNGIDRLIAIDDAKLFKGSLAERLKIIAGCWSIFAFMKFDIVFTPYRDKRYKLLSLTARKVQSRSFMGSDRLNSIIPGRCHSIEYVKLVTGCDDSEITNPVYPKVNVAPSPAIDSIFTDKKSKYIALVPGGAKNLLNEDSLRNWPIGQYKELAKKLIDGGYKIIILGAKSDEWVLESFKDIEVISLVSKTSIPELMYVLAKVNLLISHDTGILHLGKLVKTKSVGLFGPVNPFERIGKDENIRFIWEAKYLPCAPCYNGKVFADCKNNLCMKNITVEKVHDLAVSLINKA